MPRCFFCQKKSEPSFREINDLKKFLTPRKKILRREKSHLCPRHQRKLAKQIKYARFLAFIPYTSYQKKS